MWFAVRHGGTVKTVPYAEIILRTTVGNRLACSACRKPNPFCHSEELCDEESPCCEILRFAQNDNVGLSPAMAHGPLVKEGCQRS